MLENMRKQGASVFIWVIFAILIAVFVINFGPQGGGRGCKSQGGSRNRTMLTVDGHDVDEVGYRMAVNIIGEKMQLEGRSSMGRETRVDQLVHAFRGGDENARYELAFELLIRRELLAQEAERRGMRVSNDLVDHLVSSGRLAFAGDETDWKPVVFNPDGYFDYKQFKQFAKNRWGISVGTYKRQQAREILALEMAKILTGSVPVGHEEAEQIFEMARTLVAFDAVRFDPRKYASALLVTDADLDRYLAAHEAEVKATYSEALYKGKKQVHVRRIWMEKSKAAAATPTPTPTPAAGSGSGSAATPPAPPAPPKTDPAHDKLAAIKADVEAKRVSFADAAKKNDADQKVAVRGGEWGWQDVDAPTLPDPKLNAAVKDLAKDDKATGKVSDVIETDDGFYLLSVDDRREGDLKFDQVKRELAETLAREAWGKEAARRAAIKALADARAGVGKNLKEMFPAEKTGRTEWESQDVPASWGPEPTGSGSGTGVVEAGGSGSGSGSAAAAGSGSAAGSGTGSATGTGTGTGTGAGTTPSIMVPTDEKLPDLAKMELPMVESFGPLSRSNRTPLGESTEISKALFDQLTAGMIAPTIYEVRESRVQPSPTYVVMQLTSKTLADTTEFEKEADLYISNLSEQRGEDYLEGWLAQKCKEAAEHKRIGYLQQQLQHKDEDGKPVQVNYAPCITMMPPEPPPAQ